jgi:hypothetical protein
LLSYFWWAAMIEAHPVIAALEHSIGGKRSLHWHSAATLKHTLPDAGPDTIRSGVSETKKEIVMSTVVRSALVAVALLASASAAMAGPRDYRDFQSFGASSDSGRAYWDAQQRNGS